MQMPVSVLIFKMEKKQRKYCARCSAAFECCATAISRCQCSNINLDVAALAYLKDHFDDCLCIDCLGQIRAMFEPNSKSH